MMDFTIWKRAIERRSWVLGAAAFIGLILAFMVSHKGGTYFAESQVLLVNPSAGQFQAVDDTAHLSVRTEDLPALAESTSVLTSLAQAIHYKGKPSSLRPRIRVRLAAGSSIMPITFAAPQETEAITGANAIADALTSYDRDVTTSRFDNLIRDLREQLKQSSTNLVRLDHRLAYMTAEHPLLDISKDGGTPAASHIVDLESKRDDANAVLQGDQQVASGLADLIHTTQPLAMEELSESDQVYAQLKTQYATDAAHLALVQKEYSNRYPGLPELLAQQRKEITQLNARRASAIARSPLFSKTYAGIFTQKAAADAKVSSDQAEIAAYNERINAQQQQLVSSTGDSAGLAELRRQRDADDAAYAQIAARLTTAVADRLQAASLGSIAVIDRPETASIALWSTAKLLGLAFFLLSILGGLAVVYLLEVHDGHLNAPDKITNVYRAPVYSVVGK